MVLWKKVHGRMTQLLKIQDRQSSIEPPIFPCASHNVIGAPYDSNSRTFYIQSNSPK
jgi:hypothetical protein